jgi:hypothetical protein
MRYSFEALEEKYQSQERIAMFVCEQIFENQMNFEHCFEDIIEDYAFLITIVTKNKWEYEKPTKIDLTDSNGTSTTIKIFAGNVYNDLQNKTRNDILSKTLEYYNSEFKVGQYYEFTDGDLKRIQELINKLRNEINSSTVLTKDHQFRLLTKLEKLQKELHKRMSDYDRAYGIMFDGIVLIQKFGESVKPITELIRELGNLFWNANCRAEQLPSDTKLMLPESKSEC